MSLISFLPPDQSARLAEFAEKWREAALSTAPADRPRAERGIRQAYRSAGLREPERIIWCGSPPSMTIAYAVLTAAGFFSGLPVAGKLRDTLWTKALFAVKQAAQPVMSQVSLGVASPLRPAVEIVRLAAVQLLSENVAALKYRGDMQPIVRQTVQNAIREIKTVNPTLATRRSWPYRENDLAFVEGRMLFGQHEAVDLAAYDFHREAQGLVEETEPLAGLIEVALSAGWMMPFERICWVSDRLRAQQVDARGQLHADGGPALAMGDGAAVYAWHGVRVPAFVAEQPETITAESILREDNAEVRRVMMERYGEDRFWEDTGEPIHADEFGTLYRSQVWDEWGERALRVKVSNSTPEPDGSFKTYFLRVPPSVQTAREAVAWTFGMTVEQYHPIAQT